MIDHHLTSQVSITSKSPKPGGEWCSNTSSIHHNSARLVSVNEDGGVNQVDRQNYGFESRNRKSQMNGRHSRHNTESVEHKVHGHIPKLGWSKRMKHVTWAYFTITMATGGIANVLSSVPFRFRGLYEIGLVFFFVNIFLYGLIWAMMITRFVLNPSVFRESLTHPTESLFVPAFAVSLGTILTTIGEYGADRAGSWLVRVVLVLFWFDSALAVILSITIYMILWSSTSFTIAQMTPIWIFPAYPLLIIGPNAANLSRRLPDAEEAVQVIIGGFTIQGIGFLVGLTIYSAFVYRLMTQKLPAERLRPGMFVSVGPSAFTATAVIGMAENLQSTIANWTLFNDVPGLLAAQVLKLVANWMSLWLWGLSIWFFFVALVSNMQCFQKEHHMPFAMNWFSFIFPQTALCTATFAIARAFNIYALKVIGCMMTVLLIIAYFFVVFMMIRAIKRHDILWPEKGEDKEEGGFKRTRPETLSDLEEGIRPKLPDEFKSRLDRQQDQSQSLELQNIANGDAQADKDRPEA